MIGGVVGSGKSSIVELASSLVREESILLHIKFYNEKECICDFLQILLEKIIEVVNQEYDIEEFKELKKKIDECEKELLFEIEEQRLIEKSDKQIKEMFNNKNKSSRAGLGFFFSNFLSGSAEIEAELTEGKNEDINEEISYSEKITMTKRQSDKMQNIREFFKLLLPKNIIIVYDELDKMSDDILKELFTRYKGLFVENQVFHFFLVNESIYLKYSDNNMLKNPYFTYFIGIYYVSLLNFSNTLRYIKMMFGETNYIAGLATYYSSLGNYRIINTRYLSNPKREEMVSIKAYIHKKVCENRIFPYLNECENDIVVITTKFILETILRRRIINVDELAGELARENKILDVWPDYFEIAQRVIGIISQIVPEAVVTESGNVIVKAEVLWEHYKDIEDIAIKDRREKFEEDEEHLIQYSDMYPFIRKDTINFLRGLPFIDEDAIPLQVADNQTKAYEDILVNILHANLEANNLQAIVLKRARGEESYYANDHVYTGIVFVNKGKYVVAYYVNEGCYDTDGEDTLKTFIAEANKLGINVPIIKIEHPVDLQSKMKDIIKKYNRL